MESLKKFFKDNIEDSPRTPSERYGGDVSSGSGGDSHGPWGAEMSVQTGNNNYT